MAWLLRSESASKNVPRGYLSSLVCITPYVHVFHKHRPGFFGPVPGTLLRQVGRGYTDLLSALLAVGLEASELQIWKDVDGIFTADPRKVPTARLIPIVSPDEVAELTYYGSEVVHPFTMEQVCILVLADARLDHLYFFKAIRQKIPIRIKNVGNPRGGGTVIHPDPDEVSDGSDPDSPAVLTIQTLSYASPENIHQSKRLPTAVTIKERIIVLNVNSNKKSVSHGFLARIFGTLDRFGVVVDLISTSEVHVSMAIEDNLSRQIMNRLVSELQKSGSVSLFPTCPYTRPTPLGLHTHGHGDPVARRETNAQPSRHVRADVPNSCTGQRQYRDDQSRGERDQYFVCHTRAGRGQGAQLDSSELFADQAGRRSWTRCVPPLHFWGFATDIGMDSGTVALLEEVDTKRNDTCRVFVDARRNLSL